MSSPCADTLTRGAPRATLTRTTAETEIDDFCLDRLPRVRLLLFLFCLSVALKSFRVDDDAEGTQLERRKEGKRATYSLCPSPAGD